MPYGESPNKMESKKQEKYNLMHDNPVAKHASGGSWMSKHSKSAFQMGHSPAEMGHDSPAKNTETPAERRARLKKENAEKLAKGEANLARLKAEAEARKNKPKEEKEKLSGLGKLGRAIKNQFGDKDTRN
jgi:hypothetical protein